VNLELLELVGMADGRTGEHHAVVCLELRQQTPLDLGALFVAGEASRSLWC